MIVSAAAAWKCFSLRPGVYPFPQKKLHILKSHQKSRYHIWISVHLQLWGPSLGMLSRWCNLSQPHWFSSWVVAGGRPPCLPKGQELVPKIEAWKRPFLTPEKATNFIRESQTRRTHFQPSLLQPNCIQTALYDSPVRSPVANHFNVITVLQLLPQAP